MLLQNLHRRYLYIVIRLAKLKDPDQKIPTFPNCDNYSVHRSSNPEEIIIIKQAKDELNKRLM